MRSCPPLTRCPILPIATLLLLFAGQPRSGAAETELPIQIAFSKVESLVQSGPGVYVPLEGGSSLFSVTMVSAFKLSEVTVRLPGTDGASLALKKDVSPDPLVEVWSLLRIQADRAELNQKFPVGDYRFSFNYDFQGLLKGQAGLSVPLGEERYPTPPLLTDFDGGRCLDPKQTNTIQLAPFQGGVEFDSAGLSLTLKDDPTVLFMTNRPPAASGPYPVQIPANLLPPDSQITARAIYDAISMAAITNVTLVPGVLRMSVIGRSSYSRTVQFPLATYACPKLQALPSSPAEGFRFRFASTPGAEYRLESSTDLRSWQPEQTTNAADAAVDWVLPITAASGEKFYRVIAP